MPAFGTVNASVRYSFTKNVSLQLSGNNLTNAYGQRLGSWFGGMPIEFANGTTGPTTFFSQGPATYRLDLHIAN